LQALYRLHYTPTILNNNILNSIELEMKHCAAYRKMRERLTALAERSREHIWLEEQLLARLVVSDAKRAVIDK